MRKTRFLTASLVALLLVSLPAVIGCAPKSVRKSPIAEMRGNRFPDPKKAKSRAWKAFFRGEKAYELQRFDQALKYYGLAKKSSRKQAHRAASYRIGMIHYSLENYEQASAEFRYFLSKFPSSDLAFDVRYNLAASEFQQNNYDEAKNLLKRFSKREIAAQGTDRAELVYRLRALTASAQGDHLAAVQSYAAQLDLQGGESRKQLLLERIEYHLNKIDDKGVLEELRQRAQSTPYKNRITARLSDILDGGAAILSGDNRGESFKTGSSGVTPQRNRVGVILPLTGRGAAFGKKALNAIILGSQLFGERRSINVDLHIRDSQSNPITAAAAADELVYQEKVFAIIGPTSYRESLAVGRRAQRLGVTNLSLTVKEGFSSRGNLLFQNGLSARIQMENLVRHCFEEKKFTRFGILAPDDSYGREMSQVFWDLVEEYGGKVVAHELYPPKATDFQKQIRKMTGLGNVHVRNAEWEKIQEYIEQQKAEGVRNPKAKLPSIVEFDALFIPDSPRAIGQIAPSLAYFDVIGYPLLGTAEWNHPDFYKRGGKYVEGAIFPGGIHPLSTNPAQATFNQKYRKAFGSYPDLLAAQAFEALKITTEAILRTSGTNSRELANEMALIRGFSTPLGSVSFDDSRVARRTLPIYTLEYGGRIVEN